MGSGGEPASQRESVSCRPGRGGSPGAWSQTVPDRQCHPRPRPVRAPGSLAPRPRPGPWTPPPPRPGPRPPAPAAPRLPRSAPPTASAVRSRAPPQLCPASRLATQQRRAAFLPAASCAASGVRPRTATKKRKTVPVRASRTGQGFMDRCSASAAVPSTRAASHCRERGRLSSAPRPRRPPPPAPRAPPHGGHSPARSRRPACRASAPGGGRARRRG